MKNVAIIISKLEGGGAERTASNLSIFLSKYYNVHLIVFDCRNMKYPYKGTLHDLKLPPSKNKLMNIIRRTKSIKRIKKTEDITCSISFMDGPNIVNILSKYRDKVITSVRVCMSATDEKHSLKFLLNKTIMRFVSKFSYKIVALSKGVKMDLVKNYKVPSEKICIIYNPCDGKMLLNISKPNKINLFDKNEFIISTMGRLEIQKGQWHAIRAFAFAKKYMPNAKLYILGTGALELRL